MEVYERLENGGEDSLAIADSLIFTTPKGKKVYGGGGITPDYYVALDTTLDSKKLNPFFSKNWILDFCFDYADTHRESLTEKQLLERDIYTAFKLFINTKNAEFVFDLNQNERNYLIKQLKANIGRNLWGNEVFYSILLQDDRFVDRAIKEF